MDWATRALDALRRRLSSIVVRLLLINLIVMVVPLAGFWFAEVYEKQLLSDLERDMIHQTQVLREVLISGGASLAPRPGMLARITEHTGMRLRILDAHGQVQSDSGGRAIAVGERAEVKRALQGNYAAHTRLSPGRRRLNLFTALPIIKEGRTIGVVYGSRSTAQVTESLMQLKAQLIDIFKVSLGITLVVSLLLAATISRPLAKLAGVADRIAKGDTLAPLASQSHSEIGELSRSFERMRRRLQAQANQQAEIAADISHEFKSPLTSIRGAAELLLTGAAEDPEARSRFLHNIQHDSERMSRLVGRLLELSRVQADCAPGHPVKLGELVAEQCARRANVCARVMSTGLLPFARVSQLGAAISNLLDNAEQHARPHSVVEVCVWREKGQIYLRVTNQGEQISAAKLSKMWGRFYSTRHGGTGLGLVIVRSAVQAHGGTTFASCTDRATQVGFSLPAYRGSGDS